MKTHIITLLIMISSVTGIYAQKKTLDQYTIEVSGLGCPFCAYGLEKKFKEFKGLRDVTINMETGLFKFSLPAEQKLTLEQVAKQVEKAGYTPGNTEIIRSDGEVERNKSETQSQSNETATATITVAGNCDMCKARIEKAAKSVPGVQKAMWNQKTKKLSIFYDDQKSSLEAIQKRIADVGHDTETKKADTETYQELPGCCHYTRSK